MSDSPWDSKLKAFLKKTGDDFKRAGAEMKQEAERLVAEAKDPERAKKIKEGLAEVSGWAKKTAEELAGYVETGVKKAEVVLKEAVAKPGVVPPSEKPTAPDASKVNKAKQTAPAEVPAPSKPAPSAPPAAAKKTVGRGSKKSGAPKKGGAKKPLGRTKS